MSFQSPAPIPELAPGWTRERKALFLDHLSHKGNVRAACARIGLSREAAYKLRRRDPLFARGWAAALSLARDAVAEVLADRAIDGIEEKIYYRGELIDTRRKYDNRLLLAHLARLDRMVDADAAAQGNAGRFDELLACIGGAPVPDELAVDETALPLDRAMAARMEAELAAEDAREAEEGGEDREAAADAAYRDGHAEGEARWNAWFGGACAFVDALRGSPGGAPLEPAAHPTSSPPWTVSDVSTAALARALAEPVEGARRS